MENEFRNPDLFSGEVEDLDEIDGDISAVEEIDGDIESTEELEGEIIVPKAVIRDPVLREDLTALLEVGGVDPGDFYEKGTLIEKVIRDMLSPILYPDLVSPSVTAVFNAAMILEVGTIITDAEATVNFNRGKINPAYGTSGYRSGLAISYSLNGSEPQSSSRFQNLTISEMNNSFIFEVNYEEGEQPKDSEGNNYDFPLPAGSVNSQPVIFQFVVPVWANTRDITVIEKLPLSTSKQFVLNFPAQTVLNPEIFDVPYDVQTTTIEVLNELSGKYEDCAGEFIASIVYHDDASGNPIKYKRYQDNRGYAADSRTIRVTWN